MQDVPFQAVVLSTVTQMDQTQQKALNALEPYILLSKSANSPRAAADLISQAISAPNTFVFAELLQTPNIQSLQTASEDYAPYLTLLQIFAWGTWSDYTCEPHSFAITSQVPPLTQYLLQQRQTSPNSHQPKHGSSANSPSSPWLRHPRTSHTYTCKTNSTSPPPAPSKTSSSPPSTPVCWQRNSIPSHSVSTSAPSHRYEISNQARYRIWCRYSEIGTTGV